MKSSTNKKLNLFILPVLVAFILLLVSFLIGPASLWFWAGIGLGMLIWSYKDKWERSA